MGQGGTDGLPFLHWLLGRLPPAAVPREHLAGTRSVSYCLSLPKERAKATPSKYDILVQSDGLPQSVRIVEVGPRDGLQNEKEQVSTPCTPLSSHPNVEEYIIAAELYYFFAVKNN